MGLGSRSHTWRFKACFRRHAFGWRSPFAVQRVREAVSEIRKVAKTDRVLAAEGAVSFLEKVSPALAHVDSSSGAIGAAVNNAIADLVPIIASAPAGPETRAAWLDRLFEAHERDKIPYIERLTDWWGELCASPEEASRWADRLLGTTRMALSPGEEGKWFAAAQDAALFDEAVALANRSPCSPQTLTRAAPVTSRRRTPPSPWRPAWLPFAAWRRATATM